MDYAELWEINYKLHGSAEEATRVTTEQITQRNKLNFRKAPGGYIPNHVNGMARQCGAICAPYRCLLDSGHTGPHYTYGFTDSYIFDNTEEA